MVLGYKGGDFNPIGGYYQVRQKHSHAWVEALFDAGVTPDWELAGTASGGGTWYRLDPTPASNVATAESTDEGIVHRVTQTFDYLELLWRDYVLSLNARKQKDAIYEPMSHRTIASLPPWVDGRSVRAMLRRTARSLGIDRALPGLNRAAETKTVDWWSGALLTALIVGTVIVVQGLIWMLHKWRQPGGAALRARSRRPVAPAFYRRLESLLGRLPVRRARGETARELAAAAFDRLRRGSPHAKAAELPGEIVEAYYRVRFGGAALDSHEQAAIEHALAELTPAVQQAQR
jgi:transglutaminase-like putative cysteine protease